MTRRSQRRRGSRGYAGRDRRWSVGFWERAQEDPGWLAAVDPDGTEHTAGDLLARVNQLVHALRALAAARRDRGLVPNGIAPVELYLAALQAGWYYMPINWHFTGPEIAYIVRDSRGEGVLRARALRARPARRRRRGGRPPGRPARYGTVPGFRPVGELARGQPRHRARGPDRGRGDALHVGHHRQAQGREARSSPASIPTYGAELFTFCSACSASPRRRGNVHLCTSPNYHTAVTTFAGNALHSSHTVVFMDRWDPEETLAARSSATGHPHAHGADAVHPHAAAPGGRAGRSTTCRR